MGSLVEFYQSQLARPSAVEVQGAIRRLKVIAHALGPEKTKNELVDLLVAWVPEAPDDLCYVLAEELLVLLDYIGDDKVGGLPSLFRVLFVLTTKDETVVREEAVRGIGRLLEFAESSEAGAANSLIESELWPGIMKLMSDSSSLFATRLSAAALLPLVFKYHVSSSDSANEIRQGAKELIDQLLADDLPLVRRACSNHLELIVPHLQDEELDSFLLPLLHRIWSSDFQSTMRSGILRAISAVCGRLQPEENLERTLPVFQETSQSPSWKFRLALVNVLPTVIRNYRIATGSPLPPIFALLRDRLTDAESVVRIAALQSLSQVTPGPDLLGSEEHVFVTTFVQLASQDPVPAVRVECSTALGVVASLVSEESVKDHLFPLAIALLKSENHDVRVNVVKHIPTLSTTKIDSVLIDALEELFVDPQWRVRLELVNQLPKIAEIIGKNEFLAKLETLYLSAFSDPVEAVRKGVVNDVAAVVNILGADWGEKKLLPHLLNKWHGETIGDHNEEEDSYYCRGSLMALREHSKRASGSGLGPPNSSDEESSSDQEKKKKSSYMSRITVLRALPVLARTLPSTVVDQAIVPVITAAFKDPVSNVRLAATRLEDLGPVLLPVFRKHVTELSKNDPDKDVRWFASRAKI